MGTMKHTRPYRNLKMASDIEIEISKLLSSTFNGGKGEKIGMMDMARMWSLEMQWFSPDEATKMVSRLRSSNWLEGCDEALSAPSHCSLHVPELGWRPFLPKSGDFPKPPLKARDSEIIAISPELVDPEPEAYQGEESEGNLIAIVSSMSGLDGREVLRRAKRKRRALGPVSMRVSILLLAREQNLEMLEISKEIS